MKIGEIVRAGIKAGKTNDEILKDVLAQHPSANTTTKTIAWYRSDLRKQGEKVETPKQKAQSTTSITPMAPTPKGDASDPIYEVKGVKWFTGMEGHGFNATLYRDGVKVAFCIDDATGGPLQIEWVDFKDPRVETETRNYKDEMQKQQCTPEEAILWAHCLKMPKQKSKSIADYEYFMNPELFISDLVAEADLKRKFKSIMKGKVAWWDGKNVYTLKGEGTAGRYAALHQKYPNIVIFNELCDKGNEDGAFKVFKEAAGE